MPRPRNHKPSYLRHGQLHRARAVWTDPNGIQQFRILPGPYESKQSRDAYDALRNELAASPSTPAAKPSGAVSVNALLAAYLDELDRYYLREGKSLGEGAHSRVVIRHLRLMYGTLRADQFSPRKLKALRERFVEEGWSRKTVNQQIDRARRMFKWAVSEELIPETVYAALMTVESLRCGKTKARESVKVRPVADEVVDATLSWSKK